MLKNEGVDWKDRRLIMNLDMHHTAVIKVMQEHSKKSDMEREWNRVDACHNYCSPSMMNQNSQLSCMMIEAVEGLEEGLKVCGKLVCNIRFGEDNAIMEWLKALQEDCRKLWTLIMQQ